MTAQYDIALNLKAALNPLVSGRVYRLIFPQPPAQPVWPAIRYTFVSVDPESTWCGDGGEQTANYRLQLDIVDLESKGFTSFNSLCDAVKSAIQSSLPNYFWESQQEDFDKETKTLRMVLEYTIHLSSFD